MKKSQAHTTTDHNIIKRWAEERNGKPAVVEGTGATGEKEGLLRIKFSDSSDNDLKQVPWDTFFEIFDKHHLEFLFQKETAEGGKSRFFKFIDQQNDN